MKPENTIHGKSITREQAYEGLGDPSTWAADSEKLKKEMQQKHKKKILCCVDCENPLVGGYCETCKYPPSMQDTFIRYE